MMMIIVYSEVPNDVYVLLLKSYYLFPYILYTVNNVGELCISSWRIWRDDQLILLFFTTNQFIYINIHVMKGKDRCGSESPRSGQQEE